MDYNMTREKVLIEKQRRQLKALSKFSQTDVIIINNTKCPKTFRRLPRGNGVQPDDCDLLCDLLWSDPMQVRLKETV
jgi:hypothetical protein